MALSEDSNFPPRPFHRFIILYIFIFILKTHSSFQLIPFITLIFWQYIFSPEINQCSVFSSITFGRCHATSINTRRMLASQWLITFWSFGKGKQKSSKQPFLSGCANFLRGKSSSSYMHSWESLSQTLGVVASNTPLNILISKTKTNNEIRFKVVSVDICQKLSNLQKTLTSFASAYRSSQLLRPGPLFFKSEWYHCTYLINLLSFWKMIQA